MTEGKWIIFQEMETKNKTKLFYVFPKDQMANFQSRKPLGEIKWYAPWRQYAFFPAANTLYERQCLMDITKFIHHLMLDRKMRAQHNLTIKTPNM